MGLNPLQTALIHKIELANLSHPNTCELGWIQVLPINKGLFGSMGLKFSPSILAPFSP